MVLSILVPMDASISLDPLIPEAKHRMRRRRIVLAVAVLLVVVAAAVAFGLRPFGGGAAGSATAAANANHDPATPTVPFDSTERHWRATVRSLGGFPADDAALRERLTAMVHESGASVVRLIVWHGISPEAVELVVATRLRPALYLRHRVPPLREQLQRPSYLRVVDRRTSRILEEGGAGNEGFVGVPPALYYCAGVATGMPPPYKPCPVK